MKNRRGRRLRTVTDKAGFRLSRISELLKGSTILGAALSISLLSPCAAVATTLNGPVTTGGEYSDDVTIWTIEDSGNAYGFYAEDSFEFTAKTIQVIVSNYSESADNFGVYIGSEGELDIIVDEGLSLTVSAVTSGSNYGIYSEGGTDHFDSTGDESEQIIVVTVSGSTAVGGIGEIDATGNVTNSTAVGNIGIFANGLTPGWEEGDNNVEISTSELTIYTSGVGSGYGI